MTEFLPNDGTLFDDQRTKVPTEAEINSLAMRTELNQRPGVAIFVASNKERVSMRQVVKYWRQIGELHHKVPVVVDYGVREGEVRVEYPR